MWINPETMKIFKLHSNIRSAFKNISFPSQLTEEHIASVGLKKITPVSPPQYDRTKNVVEGIPELRDGEWFQVWNVTDATPEEIEDRLNQKLFSVRAKRNELLTATDWTQLADAPVDKAAWAAYRQALRDLPEQDGFPDVDMPVAPQGLFVG